MADNGQTPKKTRGGSRNKGMTWSWRSLKRDANISSEEHLIFRFIVDTRQFSFEELARICETTVEEIKALTYGVSKISHRKMVMLIAGHMGMDRSTLLLMAQKWLVEDDPYDVPVQVRALDTSAARMYTFRKRWLMNMGWDEKKLVTMQQATDFLLPDGIAPGDLLLVNTDDTVFNAGSFYVASIGGENRVCMGAVRSTQSLLIVESTGRKYLHSNFKKIQKEGGILGRIVWKGSLMP